MSNAQKAKVARAIFDELTAINKDKNGLYWKQAQLLYKLKADGLYKYVFGDEDQSWSSFLSEIKIPLSSADQKVVNWDFFVKKHNFPLETLSNSDTSCLYYISTYKKEADKEEVTEFVEKINLLGRGDFIQEVKGVECNHEGEPIEEHVLKCSSCHKKLGTRR